MTTKHAMNNLNAMEGSMEALNREQQSDEIEVLQSIYEGDVELRSNYDDPDGPRSFTVRIPGPHAIVLLIHLPVGYPSEEPPVAEIYESFGLTNAQRDQILDDLTHIFQRSNGQVCLYEWIEDVREAYSEENANVVTKEDTSTSEVPEVDVPSVDFDSDPHTLRPRVRTAAFVRDAERESKLSPLIFHGQPLTDRKSTFQAHTCPVHSPADVRSFLALLLDDRKVERAIHNMLAYRIIGEYVVKDNDEDGEDGAGSKLSHLLELTGAENVAVVVTRWFGGIKLGPDRFKHINTVARQALDEAGLLQVETSSKKNKK